MEIHRIHPELLSQVVKLFRIHAARHYHGAAVSIRQFRSASFDPASGAGIFRPRQARQVAGQGSGD